MDFVQRCAAACGMPLSEPAVEVDERGLQHLVLVDRARGIVARFPRTHAGCSRIPDAAARLCALHAYGLPVPAVLGVRADGGPGAAHLLLSYVPGEPLDTVDTDRLAPAALSSLVASLIAVTEAIHSMPVASWPSPAPDWAGHWAHLVERVAACPNLSPRQRGEQLLLADEALRVARNARIGLFHGDLGGVNCRIDPAGGRVLSILDWDSASIGDVATDLVAVLQGVGPATAQALRAADARWASAWLDYRAYVATWPMQGYLWSLRQGTDADRSAALAQLSLTPTPTAVR